MTGAWHGVQLVQFDSGGQKCAASPPFPSAEARVVTDVLLASIKEGQATIDPRGGAGVRNVVGPWPFAGSAGK